MEMHFKVGKSSTLKQYLIFSAPTSKENVFPFGKFKICTPPTALKMIQIAFNSSFLCFCIVSIFQTGCHSLQLPPTESFVGWKQQYICGEPVFKVELSWKRLLLGRLDGCQCAEWIRWIQKSQAMFNEVCVCFFVVSGKYTKLANFSVHFGMKNLPCKERKIEEQTKHKLVLQKSTITGWLMVFAVFILVGFSLILV